MQLQKYKT